MVRAAIAPGQTTFLDLDDVVVDLYMILDDDDDMDHLLHDVDQVSVLDGDVEGVSQETLCADVDQVSVLDGDVEGISQETLCADVDQVSVLDGDDHQILDDAAAADQLLHDVDQGNVLDDVDDNAHADDVDQVLQLQPAPGVPTKSRPKEGRRKRIAEILKKGLVESTQHSYAKQFAKFDEWCRENDEMGLPADPEAIADYLIERAEDDGWSGATLKVAWAGIADRHRNEGFNEIAIHAGVRQTVRSLVKSDLRPQVQARPLRKEDMERIRGAAWVPRTTGGRRPRKETPAETRKRALLDIAICSTLRDGMLRRSELAALRWRDVQFLDSGLGLILIRRSKTDQEGKGAEQALGPECAQDLREIMPEGALVDPELPVIGLSGSQIGRRMRAMCIAAGLGDGFTGHSGRVGMAKDLRASGAEIAELMDAGRWKTAQMVGRYTKEEEAARGVIAKYYEKEGRRLRDDGL